MPLVASVVLILASMGLAERAARSDAMSARRLPPGVRRRGTGFTYTWRDARGQQFSRKAGNTLDEAIAYKTRIDAERLMGTFQANSRTKFADYAAQWVEVAPLKPQTRQRYQSIVHTHLIPAFGPLALPKIHPQLVRAWLAEQTATDLSASSVRQHAAVLRSCLRAAQTDGHISALPTSGLRLPRAGRRRARVLSLREALDLVEAAPEQWRTAIATAVFTGLRLGELLALTRDDVDLARGMLTVNATLTQVPNRRPRLRREPPKSDAGVRDVPLVPLVAYMLADHLARLGPTEEGVVFANGVGRFLDSHNFYRDCWYPTRAAAGHPTMVFHELRHTAASLLLAHANASLAELKVILGHSQIAHTVDIYGHLVPGRLTAIRDSFGDALEAASIRPYPSDRVGRADQTSGRHLRLIR
ncbi:MAG TPA: tyrosine-type recombinase/integrase [Frankiaceae bacterium]|nr:tyrosine-type recombinase/integrase [Frankiaceae bacterium]